MCKERRDEYPLNIQAAICVAVGMSEIADISQQ